MSARTMASSSTTRMFAFLCRFRAEWFILQFLWFNAVWKFQRESRGISFPTQLPLDLLRQHFDQAQSKGGRLLHGKICRQTAPIIAHAKEAGRGRRLGQLKCNITLCAVRKC